MNFSHNDSTFFGSGGMTIASGGSSSMHFGNRKGTVTIDGTSYTGYKIEMRDGEIWVDGTQRKPTDADGNAIHYKLVSIEVSGDVERVDAGSAPVTVRGAAGRIKTMSGSVKVHGECLGVCSTMSGSIHIDGNYECRKPPSTMSGNVSIQNQRR